MESCKWFCHLVNIGLLGDLPGDLDGTVLDLGEGRVEATHGQVAFSHLKVVICDFQEKCLITMTYCNQDRG